MKKIRDGVAGIDIGSCKVFVSVEGQQVRSFDTFTSDMKQLADYLLDHKIKTVAMEATGHYWVILYEILDEAGLDVWLVDGRQTRQVPGRKTDVKDCQWIQQLHSYGLLNRCHVTTGQLKEIRSYQRMREDHLRSASMHINHMHKALIEMNIRLPEVLSQVHGSSGMAIIEAILDGERDKMKLLSLCHKSVIKNKKEEVLKALEGYYTHSGIFALRQAHDAYLFYQKQILDCDKEISRVLREINKDQDEPSGQKKKIKRKAIRHNAPDVEDLGIHLLKIFGGRDATVLPGITDYNWLQLFCEIGVDLSKWQTEKHFTSWLGLSPGQNDSGKKKRNKRKGRPKAGQIFRHAAQSLITSKKIALGAFGRKLRGRKGPGVAIKAMARKLAVLYWRLMVMGNDYVEKGVTEYEAIVKQHKEKYLRKMALDLGMELSPAN